MDLYSSIKKPGSPDRALDPSASNLGYSVCIRLVHQMDCMRDRVIAYQAEQLINQAQLVRLDRPALGRAHYI